MDPCLFGLFHKYLFPFQNNNSGEEIPSYGVFCLFCFVYLPQDHHDCCSLYNYSILKITFTSDTKILYHILSKSASLNYRSIVVVQNDFCETVNWRAYEALKFNCRVWICMYVLYMKHKQGGCEGDSLFLRIWEFIDLRKKRWCSKD